MLDSMVSMERTGMKKQLVTGSVLVTLLTVAAAWAVDSKDGALPAQKEKVQETAKPSGPAKPVEIEGIENTFWLGRKIISGACPNGEAGFRALGKMGVKTIISVDGARPDEKVAKKYGMRYVHIPVTYGGVSRAQALSIGRAVRDLPGPVFIHCHHGKHRGPTAAVMAAMIAEGWTTIQAQDAMKQAGTSPNYTGLWASAREFKKPTKKELRNADHSFPVAAVIDDTAAAMVDVDEKWDHLGDVRKAKWSVPADSPDIDPPHQALLLRESFTELLRAAKAKNEPADYLEKMAYAETSAAALETALREKNAANAETAYKAVEKSCKSCHVVYRDANRPE